MSKSSKRVRGQNIDRLFDDFDWKQDKAEMVEILLQMKCLNADEARLDRKKWLEGMKNNWMSRNRECGI